MLPNQNFISSQFLSPNSSQNVSYLITSQAAGVGGRRSLLSHLTSAHHCLKSISHEAFARNLTILAYKTFLEKVMSI